MQILKLILLTVLILMSVFAGTTKMMRMPQELEFLSHIGLNEMAVMALGVIQALGGVLLALKKTRKAGAVLAIIALLFSGLALFVSGNTGVGLITLIPIAIGVMIFRENT